MWLDAIPVGEFGGVADGSFLALYFGLAYSAATRFILRWALLPFVSRDLPFPPSLFVAA